MATNHARPAYTWVVLAAFVAILAFTSLGCALARLGGGLAARGGAGLGIRAGIGAARAGVAAADVAAVRGAVSAMARGGVRISGSRVVTSRGGVLGDLRMLGPNHIVIRGTEGGLSVHAIRQGSTVSYRALGRAVGHSEFRSGATHHYVYQNGRRYIGYDVVRGNRVFQYDPHGVLLAETAISTSSSLATSSAVAMAALIAASIESERRIDQRIGTLATTLEKFASQ